MMKKFLLCILIGWNGLIAYGGWGGAFLSLGVGARALGLGSAFTSISDDATAVYWNPAGYATLKKSELQISYGALFEDRRQTLLAYNRPLGILSIGLGWLNYSISGISARDEYGQPIGELNDSENAFMFGFTLRHGLIIEDFNVYPGFALKYLYQSLAGYRATGWGADFGVIAKREVNKFGIKGIGFAAALQNIGASLKWNTFSEHKDKIPVTQKYGGHLKFTFLPMLFTIDYVKVPDYEVSYFNYGIEGKILSFLTLRAGLNREKYITAGFSLPYKIWGRKFELHYGYSTDPISANGIHKFAISYLGPAPEKKPLKFTPPPPETTLIAVPETTKVVKPETLLVKAPEKPKIELEPVYFDFNKWEIKPEYEEVLKRDAEKLSKYFSEHPELKLLIIGHTSDEGSAEYNIRLGLKRALAVKDYLVKLGIDESRILIESRGFAEPIDLKNPGQNRRVEFEIKE